MRRILYSLASAGAVASLAIAATGAFFSDTEVSEDNVLAAGALDLKIDSTAHYAGMVCQLTDNGYVWVDETPDNPNDNPRPELLGTACVGTWELKDLEEGDTFFDLIDIKPGDGGENTISLHVFDNDAWGRIRLENVLDEDVDCTEPETESSDPECSAEPPVPGEGELSESLAWEVWLDQGQVPGFQNYPNDDLPDDPGEGDNIRQKDEPVFDGRGIQEDGSVLLSQYLRQAYRQFCTVGDGVPAEGVSPDGHDNYGNCHGLALDGRLVGSATYYIGVAWSLPGEVGNEVQTDSIFADIAFDVEQHRNNPTPWSP
jgi:predicted ribosomally synthesized peptide with SipW-like signal peptide